MSTPSLVVSLKQQTRGNYEEHSDRYLRANWRPAFLTLEGGVARQLRDSKLDGTYFKLTLRIEYENNDLIRFHKARNNGGDEFRFQYARRTSAEYHELKGAEAVFVTGEALPGQLALWQHFSIESSTDRVSLSMKFSTNVTSKQHSEQRMQFRALLSSGSMDRIAEGTSLALPFFARAPTAKDMLKMGRDEDIQLASDEYRPGDSVYIIGDCFSNSPKHTAVRCAIRSVEDGTTQELQSDHRQGRKHLLVTKIPSGTQPGVYELRIWNLETSQTSPDFKVFQVKVLPSHLWAPVMSVVEVEQPTHTGEGSTRAPFAMGNAIKVEPQVPTLLSTGGIGEDRPLERQSSLDSVFSQLCGSDCRSVPDSTFENPLLSLNRMSSPWTRSPWTWSIPPSAHRDSSISSLVPQQDMMPGFGGELGWGDQSDWLQPNAAAVVPSR